MEHNEATQLSQKNNLSPEEERVVSFFELLIEIDRRKQSKLMQNDNAEEIVHEA